MSREEATEAMIREMVYELHAKLGEKYEKEAKDLVKQVQDSERKDREARLKKNREAFLRDQNRHR